MSKFWNSFLEEEWFSSVVVSTRVFVHFWIATILILRKSFIKSLLKTTSEVKKVPYWFLLKRKTSRTTITSSEGVGTVEEWSIHFRNFRSWKFTTEPQTLSSSGNFETQQCFLPRVYATINGRIPQLDLFSVSALMNLSSAYTIKLELLPMVRFSKQKYREFARTINTWILLMKLF